MPKTRSGKIMRRVLGAMSNDRDVGDVMTLANPEIVEEIKKWSRNNFQIKRVGPGSP
jgi:acetyl-CoA synthetase